MYRKYKKRNGITLHLFYTKEKSVLKKSLYYFCVLLTFAAGAGLGGMLTKIYGIHAIWFSCLLLIISFCIMFIKEEIEKYNKTLETP